MAYPHSLLMSFGAPLQAVGASVQKALAFMHEQATVRTLYKMSTLEPTNPNVNRYSSGTWTGTFTDPVNPSPPVPYTPVLILEPVNFPMDPAKQVDFRGTVDWPFLSMDGFAGFNGTAGTEWPNGGTRIGSFFIIGSVGGVTQFRCKVAPNGYWLQNLPPGFPAGDWEFQLATYATEADFTADANRILIGLPWKESERPGDIRQYYGFDYVMPQQMFVAVGINKTPPNVVITGTVENWAAQPGMTYAVLVTQEADVEYAWAIEPVTIGGPFTISRPLPIENKWKLRLVEMKNGATQRVIGGAWSSINNPGAPGFRQDMQVEYRSITNTIPPVADTIVPARTDYTWSVILIPPGTGQVRLVDNNTRRILGQYTMETGLLRSFNVPADKYVQNLVDGVYYEEFSDTAFLYDQGVALIGLIQMGHWDLAKKLLLSLVNSQNPDGSYPFAVNQAAVEQQTQDFIRNGAVAWVIYAMLIADQPQFRQHWYTSPKPAIDKGLAFLASYRNEMGLIDGGRGNPGDPAFVIPWWSCEHNLDAWWCFDLARRTYGGGSYASIADTIKLRLLDPEVGWSDAEGIFWQGGVVTPGEPIVTASWAAGVVTYTFARSTGILPSQPFTIGGTTQAGYNGNFTAITGSNGLTVKANMPVDPGPYIPTPGRPNGYLAGTPRSTSDGSYALDMHSWGGATLQQWGMVDRLQHAMDRAYAHYYVTDPDFGWSGFTTFVPEDGYPPTTVKSPWYEGSFGCVIALRYYDVARAMGLARTLVYAQMPDGGYYYVLKRDFVNGIENFPSLIGAAWNVLAYSGTGTPNKQLIWV